MPIEKMAYCDLAIMAPKGGDISRLVLDFTCSCGVQVIYPEGTLPGEDTRMPCRNPDHWIIRFWNPNA
jgi:hypothetical protein